MINSQWRRIISISTFFRNRLLSKINTSIYIDSLKGKKGLEIGGPSDIFDYYGIVPIYSVIGELDGCNFNKETIWEGKIEEGHNYRFSKKKKSGYQYICEANSMQHIPDNSYDFILASHVLEHLANPMKAISEWLRILTNEGLILMVVPDKNYTFDHKRPITPFEHILEDFEKDVKEDDLTHLPEIIELHDLRMDPHAKNITYFKSRSLLNYKNRCLHHHVFDVNLIMSILKYFNLKIIKYDWSAPHHIIVLAGISNNLR